MPPYQALEERFPKYYLPEPNSGCWIWTGAVIDSNGAQYGVIKRDLKLRKLLGGSNDLAHRVAYRLYKGPLLDTEELDHVCANTYCVNPAHLEIATRVQNIRLGHTRRYGNACKRGHEYTPENLWIEKNGQRHCRKCHAANAAKRRERLKNV